MIKLWVEVYAAKKNIEYLILSWRENEVQQYENVIVNNIKNLGSVKNRLLRKIWNNASKNVKQFVENLSIQNLVSFWVGKYIKIK